MRIFLWGMMGAGKTSLASLSSKILNIKFFDLDEQIQNSLGADIPKIFASKGEDFFRHTESKILRQIIAQNQSFIMATGGGTPIFFNNAQLMNSSGKTILILCPIRTLAIRLWPIRQSRPLLKNLDTFDQMEQSLTHLWNKRKNFYFKAQFLWDCRKKNEFFVKYLKAILNSF